jgi:hypothetical protein
MVGEPHDQKAAHERRDRYVQQLLPGFPSAPVIAIDAYS